MQDRNLDFEIPVTREQWEMLGRRAAALGPAEGGFAWREDEPERITVYLRADDAKGAPWSGLVTGDEERFGRAEREVARFVYNDGRPFAQLETPRAPDEPVVTERQERGMQADLERWVRDKWHQLMKESGLHYVRGRVPHG